MKRFFYLLVFLLAFSQVPILAASYPQEYKTDHFVIHYNADSVLSRKDKRYTPLEKIDIDDSNKATLKGTIAAGIGPRIFPRGGEKLYAFSTERK